MNEIRMNMKTLVCTRPGAFDYQDAARPVLKKDHAIVKIKRIGICGTDLYAYRGTQPFFSYPRILGHELSGDLLEIGSAAGFEPGEAVAIIPYLSCGYCVACRSGKSNCCVRVQVCGVHIDGGMVQYLQVPASALVQGKGLSYDELALIEPLAIGAHGISRAGVKKGDMILVIGAGPIGLAAMEFARIAGGQIIAMDISNDKLAFCRTKLGIKHTLNPMEGNAVEQLQAITGGDMASIVIDATGNLKAINDGINYLAHGGSFILIGLQKEAFSLSHPEFHKRETTLMSSRNATKADFEEVTWAIKKKLVDPQIYITHRLDFNNVKQEFENLLLPESKVIKAMIHLG